MTDTFVEKKHTCDDIEHLKDNARSFSAGCLYMRDKILSLLPEFESLAKIVWSDDEEENEREGEVWENGYMFGMNDRLFEIRTLINDTGKDVGITPLTSL